MSIVPAISQLLERLMCEKMLSFINKYSLLTKWHFGFRQHRSTKDATAHFVDCVTQELDLKHNECSLFIDVGKAFDSLNHDIHLFKLFAFGFREKIYAW